MKRTPLWPALWLYATLLAACAAPPPSAPPLPTPQAIRIQYPPSLTPLLSSLSLCLREFPALSPHMEERPPTRLDPSAADLTLWWGEQHPAADFAFLLGYDTLEVVRVPRGAEPEPNPIQVAALYRGYPPPGSKPAPPLAPEVWTYPQGHPFRAPFEDAVLRGGRTTTAARLAPHADIMLEGLRASPGAIGYLPAFQVPPDMQILAVDIPAQPVLVLMPAEPQGAARNLLACWQAGLAEVLSPAP